MKDLADGFCIATGGTARAIARIFCTEAKSKAHRTESRGGVLGEGAARPSPPARGSGECCKPPSGVLGEALAAKLFSRILSVQSNRIAKARAMKNN